MPRHYTSVCLLLVFAAAFVGCDNMGSSALDDADVPRDPLPPGGDDPPTFIDAPSGGPVSPDSSRDDGEGGSGDGGRDDDDDSNAPVPEPTTVLLIGSGLVGLAYQQRRRRTSADRRRRR